MTISIQKWGNSQGVRLPKHLLESLHWIENDSLEISIVEDKIVLQKSKPQYQDIRALFADYHEDYHAEEVDWGKPEGNEVW